ncbi:MAG: SPFH domain-containing protein [Clostridia bacterium]|nr:SPFH domain-containing protein [Clostridia bacterium]
MSTIDKNGLDVIKCVSQNYVLVEKSTVEDFNTKSQLIVNESQEALFYKDGQALDLFGAGRHSLNTENLPLLKRLYGAIFGGKTPFSCEVFFINKVSVLDTVWGTSSPIPLIDPKYDLPIGVRANGQTGLRVKDSRKFVVRVVGQLPEYTVESVRRAIKGTVMLAVKEVIASTIVEQGVSILEITTRLSELSALMQKKLNTSLDDLGLEVVHFTVNTIVAGEDDLAKLRETKETRMERITDADMKAYETSVMSEARAKARAMEGYTYQEERKFDVMQAAAENKGTAGGMIGAGVGLGVGLGVMDEARRTTASTMGQQGAAPAAPATRSCPHCGQSIPKQAKFCPECGQQLPPENKFCTECGTQLAPGSKFCPECGTRV